MWLPISLFFFFLSLDSYPHVLSLALLLIQWEAGARVHARTAVMYGIVSSVVLLLPNPRPQTWPCGSLWTSTPWPSSHYSGQELPGNLDYLVSYPSKFLQSVPHVGSSLHSRFSMLTRCWWRQRAWELWLDVQFSEHVSARELKWKMKMSK